MVLGTSSDVLGEGMQEDADYLGALYNDEGPDNDHADFMAATGQIMQNPRVTSIFASPRGWRALRLPGARGSERQGLLNFMSQLIPFWKGDTIRDSPFATMVPARMWNDYINNMTATDDAVELAAPHSQAEELSLMLFCEEWANDPGHTAFRRRLIQHPMVTASDAVMKGNLIYNLAVGELRLRSVPLNAPNKLPYRLMLDILKSIPFDSYSYYELNNVHTDEGLQVYTDFLNRYTPLTATEVAMVEELRRGTQGAGRSFASMTTNVNGDPVEAYAIMLHTVEAYEVGDTMSVRANINTLMSPPYNYRSTAAQVNITGPAGGNYVATDEIIYLKFKPEAEPLTAKFHPGAEGKDGSPQVMLRTFMRPDGTRGRFESKGDLKKEGFAGYYLQLSTNGLFVENVWENLSYGSGNDKWVWRKIDEDNYGSKLASFRQSVESGTAASDRRQDDRRERRGGDEGTPRRGRDRIRRNPDVRENFGKPKFTFDGPGKVITAVADTATLDPRDMLLYSLVFASSTKTLPWLKKHKDDLLNELMADGSITFDLSKGVTKALKKGGKQVEAMMDALVGAGYKLQEYFSSARFMLFSHKGTIMNKDDMQKMWKEGVEKLDKVYPRSNPYKASKLVFDKTYENPSGRFGAGSTLGRGKYFYIQILPESRVEFKGKAKTGKGKRADSKQKKGGTRVTDPTGFGKVLPGSIGKGYYIKTGIHKRTGTEEPWLIALPREHFKTFTDSTKGGSKGLRTVKPFKASESVKKAWKKFTKYYGHPVFAGTEGNPNFFRIHRDHKGEYYDKLRSKPTKKE